MSKYVLYTDWPCCFSYTCWKIQDKFHHKPHLNYETSNSFTYWPISLHSPSPISLYPFSPHFISCLNNFLGSELSLWFCIYRTINTRCFQSATSVTPHRACDRLNLRGGMWLTEQTTKMEDYWWRLARGCAHDPQETMQRSWPYLNTKGGLGFR